MPGMALRTVPNRSVIVGLSHGVALFATGRGCRMPFWKHQRIRWTLRSAWLELLAERDLLCTQAFFTVNGGPTWSCMATTQEFLVDAFVTGAAIASCQMRADHEAVMIDFLLACGRLVTVKAIDALLRVSRHFVFVNDRILQPCVTFGALSRRPDKIGCRLLGFDCRARPIHEKTGKNKRKRDDDGQEHGTERHAVQPPGEFGRLCPA
jgi:hypothetical protein